MPRTYKLRPDGRRCGGRRSLFGLAAILVVGAAVVLFGMLFAVRSTSVGHHGMAHAYASPEAAVEASIASAHRYGGYNGHAVVGLSREEYDSFFSHGGHGVEFRHSRTPRFVPLLLPGLIVVAIVALVIRSKAKRRDRAARFSPLPPTSSGPTACARCKITSPAGSRFCRNCGQTLV